MAKYLIAKGADVNAKNTKYNKTVMDFAKQFTSNDACIRLLEENQQTKSVVMWGWPSFNTNFPKQSGYFDMKVDEKGLYYECRGDTSKILCYKVDKKQWIMQNRENRSTDSGFAYVSLNEYGPVSSLRGKTWKVYDSGGDKTWKEVPAMQVELA